MSGSKKPEKIIPANYGSIGHLPFSRLGPGEHHVPIGQEQIACFKVRDGNDLIIVQEKLDGSNVGVYMREDKAICAITRKGYACRSSNYPQHVYFHKYVELYQRRFQNVLRPRERIAGEWLLQAHGTRYDLIGRDPFVAFDIFTPENTRLPYFEFVARVMGSFSTPPLLHIGESLPIKSALKRLGDNGFYGALDGAEGIVYRVERRNKHGVGTVDYLAKYVRPDKIDGRRFPENNHGKTIWNRDHIVVPHYSGDQERARQEMYHPIYG